MDLIFVLLQPDQPPATDAHHEEGQEASQHYSHNESAFSTTGQSHENSAPCGRDQDNCKSKVASPGASSKFAAKDGKEAKDFNGE
jgi:hypothetical protein